MDDTPKNYFTDSPTPAAEKHLWKAMSTGGHYVWLLAENAAAAGRISDDYFRKCKSPDRYMVTTDMVEQVCGAARFIKDEWS